METLRKAVRGFYERQRTEHSTARACAAFQVHMHEDLVDALSSPSEIRARLAARLTRQIERERLKGMARHWSYDLNRHIGLKEALDLLSMPAKGKAGTPLPRAGSVPSSSGSAC